MGITEDMADELALATIKYVDASGDDGVVEALVKVLGSSSQSAEEAFMVSIRVRRANSQARDLLAKRVKAFKASQTKQT